MTREEIITRLEGMKGNGYKEQEQAVDEAIEIIKSYPCEDAVSREAVLELVADYDLSMGQVVRDIHALPPVTPKQRTGKWIVYKAVNTGEILSMKCGRCGYEVFRTPKFNYCPNCGAKMKGESE